MNHTLNAALYTERIHTLLIGCGGTGAVVASGLYYLDAALRAHGHAGLSVTVMDGDVVSSTNCARTPYLANEVGMSKAIILVNRVNLSRGLAWTAVPRHFREGDRIEKTHLVISCVDSRAARALIHQAVTDPASAVVYWFDLGNLADGGQVVLGEPLNRCNPDRPERLPTVAELFPEILVPSPEDDTLPSCSAAEALQRQEPFINQMLADGAMALLTRLFRHGAISYHGLFTSLATGWTVPIEVDPQLWEEMRRRSLPAEQTPAKATKGRTQPRRRRARAP